MSRRLGHNAALRASFDREMSPVSMDQIPEATAWNAWARYYDLADGDRTPYVAFYSGLLSDRTRSVLELGCGTGAILSALARIAGARERAVPVRFVGVDASVGMLHAARSREVAIEWVLGDMRCPPVEGQFDVVYSCYNTLQHLVRDEDLLQTFHVARDLMRVEGTFAFDMYQPNVAYLSVAQTDRLARSITDSHGDRLEIREDHVYASETRMMTIDWRLLDPDKPSAAPLAQTRYRLRQYFAADIERLLASAGLAIRERYGDFDRSAFTEQSKKQILICRRA
jgi:SAM-dependent methyltransferase